MSYSHFDFDNILDKAKCAASELLSNVKKIIFDKGESLDLNRKHRPDYAIFIFVIILSLLGLLVIFTIAPGQNWRGEDSELYFIGKQILYLVVGLAAFFIAGRLPLDFWRKFSAILLVVAFGLCLLVAIGGRLGLGIAVGANGAYRWLSLGPLGTFQPAELMKFALLIFTALSLANAVKHGTLNSFKKTLLPLGAIVIFALIIVVILQSDLSSGVVLMAIFLAQLIVSGMNWRNIGLSFLPLLAGGVLAIIAAPYRLGRLATFLNSDSLDEWDQISLSLMSLGSGGAFGKGLGQSVGAFGWVPEALNDAIFPIIGEMLGYCGVLFILIIFAALLVRILRMAEYLPNIFLRLIVVGVFAWILAQAFINIAAMTGIIPVTGITLPFLSFGGSSMLCVMAAMGVVFAISRYTSHRKIDLKKEGQSSENSMRRGRLGRTRYTSYRGY